MSTYQTFTLGDLVLTDFPFSVEFGGEKGSPESITDVVAALLSDGDLVVRTRAGNRALRYVVGVEGTDFLDLARNEALLVAECNKPRNLWTIDPGDGFGPPTAFETLPIDMTPIESDDEHSALYHRWELSIPALPWGLSVSETIAEPVPSSVAPLVESVLDDCSSLSGWTNAELASPAGIQPLNGLRPLRTGVVDFSTLRFLRIRVSGTAYSDTPSIYADGQVAPLVSSTLVAQSVRDFIYEAPAGLASASTLQFRLGFTDLLNPPAILSIIQASAPPVATRLQTNPVIPVGGTQRTPASLSVSSSSGLGFTVVHTSPDDGNAYSPAMRPWRARGNTVVADSTCISGFREKIHPDVVAFEIPAANVPADGYTLGGWMKANATGSVRIFWATHTIVDGEIRGVVLSDAPITFTAGVWQFVEFPELLTLPTVAVKSASDALVHVSLQRNPDPLVTVEVELDELWLFREGEGSALTIIDTGDKTSLWVDSASSDSAVPEVWIGNSADQSDAHHPGGYRIIARGQHDFTPPASRVYVASSTGLDPVLRLTHHNRWHTNAAD